MSDNLVWSNNGEDFNHCTMADAVSDFVRSGLYEGGVVVSIYSRTVTKLTVDKILDNGWFLTTMNEDFSDYYDIEIDEDWPGKITPEARSELKQALNEWIEKHCPIKFGLWGPQTEHLLSAAEVFEIEDAAI